MRSKRLQPQGTGPKARRARPALQSAGCTARFRGYLTASPSHASRYAGLGDPAQCADYIWTRGKTTGCQLLNLRQAEYLDINICVNGSAEPAQLQPSYFILQIKNLGEAGGSARPLLRLRCGHGERQGRGEAVAGTFGKPPARLPPWLQGGTGMPTREALHGAGGHTLASQ